MSMIVLAILVIAVALVLAVLFIAVVVGTRQEHPTDLALQPPSSPAALARRVLALHVRRDESKQHSNSAADRDWAAR